MEAVQTKSRLKGAIETRIGGRSENQDYYGYCDTPLGFAVTVCDGMGGMQGGQIASSVAVSSILSYLLAAETLEPDVEIIKRAIRKANRDVIDAAAAHGISGMGTTLTLLVINDRCAMVTHLGDSRVYQLRGHDKHFRTFDHSMVFEMVRSGVLTEEQARLSENSNIITNGLGIFPDVDPEVSVLPYESGDRFALCSDGIWGTMKEADLLSLLTERTDLGSVVQKVADRVDGLGHSKGGHHDNMTLALIQVETSSKLKEEMTKKSKIIIGVLAGLLLLSAAGNVAQLCLRDSKDVQTVEAVPENSPENGAASEDSTGEESPLDQEGEKE